MTENEILNALQLCAQPNSKCTECPYFSHLCADRGCIEENAKDLLDLINRQRAEIERLNSANAEKFRQWDMLAEKTKQHYADLYNEAKNILKAEAYKEFAKKLKEEIRLEDDCDYNCRECCYECSDYVISIDNLLKEMVGEE